MFYCHCLSTLVAIQATLNFHRLIMGKMKIDIFCYFTADILTKFFWKCLLSGPLPNIYFLSKPLNLIGWHGNPKDQFAYNIKKINSSEAIWGMKLKLCRNVHSISFYKNIFFFFFFYCCCICTLVVMATSSFHRLIMGKMKIGFNCWLIADIWTERFKNRLLSSFPPSRQICKLLILICCHCHSF